MKLVFWKKNNPVDDRKAQLRQEIELSNRLTTFCLEAIKRGYPAQVLVVVDGIACESAIATGQEGKVLLEYIGNFSAGMFLKLHAELEYLEKVGDRFATKRASKGL